MGALSGRAPRRVARAQWKWSGLKIVLLRLLNTFNVARYLHRAQGIGLKALRQAIGNAPVAWSSKWQMGQIGWAGQLTAYNEVA